MHFSPPPCQEVWIPSAATLGGFVIENHRWYRIAWLADKDLQRHFVVVKPWNPLAGDYEGFGVCVYRTWSGTLPGPGDIWLGSEGTVSGTRFKGLIDNLVVKNYNDVTVPDACLAL